MYDTIIPKLVNSKNEITEATNRFQQLRKEDATPNQKIGKGIREMRTQIQEIEKFVEWYSKIKTENDLDSSQYWKRTQKHLNVIRERLNKISQKIQNLSV
jgi:septation ring formation regulator EzrA